MKYIVVLIALTSIIFSNINDTNSSESKEYKLVINVHDSLDKDAIAKAIGVKEKDLLNLWSSDYIITQEFLETLDATLKGYLENRGYFNAKVDKQIVGNKVILNITPNEPIRVTSISKNTDFNLKTIIDWKKGDIFTSERFTKIKDKINKKLLENGYCHSKVDTKAYIDIDSLSAKLNYNIQKGDICYFGKIYIKKYPKDIKKEVILSRLRFKEGEKFDIRKIEESYDDINALNIFANLQIKYSLDNISKRVDTTISVDKKEKLRKYLFALGVDSEIGFRIKGLWENRDFLDNAKKVKVHGAFSKDTQEIVTTLFAPAFMNYKGVYLDYYISMGLYKDDNSGYKEKKGFINSYLNYKYGSLNIKTGIELDRLVIDLKKSSENVIGGTFNILYPYLLVVYDKRDSKIDPKNGYYFSAYGEYGISFRVNDVNYFKYLFEARAIKSFGDLTLSAVGKLGAIHEINGKLPASKLFYGGGLFSNRAYGKDKIGVVQSFRSFSSLGGKSFLNLQLEVNYKIHKRFYGALFFDSTMISQDEYNFKGKRIDTLGVGLRYKTPIGPIKIDVGFNIHNKKDYAISIMLGQSF